MKKNYLLNVLVLCCGLFVCTIARAESDKDEPSNTKARSHKSITMTLQNK